VNNYYLHSVNAVGDDPQPVSFESDSIALDIPEEGAETKGGWTIESITKPVVGINIVASKRVLMMRIYLGKLQGRFVCFTACRF